MKVEFIDKWGDDKRVSNVARVSFNKWKEEFDDSDARLIDYLARHEHLSPFRHVGISIRCKAPVFIARQAQKHVVGLSWNEVSRRYVDSAPEFYYPDSWRSRPDGSVKQGSAGVHPYSESVQYTYEDLIEYCLQTYEDMIRNGVAPEQARMILPQSMLTEWIWTGSLQAFAHLCHLRLEASAQKEWEDLAKPIADLCKEHFPVSWRALMHDHT